MKHKEIYIRRNFNHNPFLVNNYIIILLAKGMTNGPNVNFH